jgi:hypothetical protein
VTTDQQFLDHLKWLIDTDRDYAKAQIPWYFKTAPWLEAAIGPALREHWAMTAPVGKS